MATQALQFTTASQTMQNGFTRELDQSQVCNQHLPKRIIEIIQNKIGPDSNKWPFKEINIWDCFAYPEQIIAPIYVHYNPQEKKVTVQVVKLKNSMADSGASISEFSYRDGHPLDHFPYRLSDNNPVYDNETNISLSATALQEALHKA